MGFRQAEMFSLRTEWLLTYRRGEEGEWRRVKAPKRAFKSALARHGLAGHHVFHKTKAAFVTAVALGGRPGSRGREDRFRGRRRPDPHTKPAHGRGRR